MTDCPQCNQHVDIMPANPMWDYPTGTWNNLTGPVGIDSTGATSTFATTAPIVETKRTYKCVNPKCWVTKIRVEWE